MGEPEEVIIDGAHRATLMVQKLWQRNSAARQPELVRLADVRGRLELFVSAAFGISLRILQAEQPISPNFFARIGRRIPKHLLERRILASTDGIHLHLPPTLPAADGLLKYRLLASQSAARAARGTPAMLPAEPLQRFLYLLREAAAVDRWLAESLPGLQPALRAARDAECRTRPDSRVLTPRERAVEAELISTLEYEMPDVSGNPAESAAWALKAAARFEKEEGPFRGLPAVAYWGQVTAPPATVFRDATTCGDPGAPPLPARVSKMKRRPKVREATPDEDDPNPGMLMIQVDDPQQSVEDPMGLQRPTDRDDEADPDDLGDSLSELPEARLVDTPGSAREILSSDDPAPRGIAEVTRGNGNSALFYPEWDYRRGAYIEHGAVIRERVAPEGDPAWARAVLRRRAALLQEVRRRFERLRPRRQRLGRQPDGPEIDLEAYVASHADRRAGCPPDDRLYQAIRPARRDVAIALLVDVSGSTDSWVSGESRVIDVEKEALLVVCAALEALGDPFTILAFSGEGPEAVRMLSLKSFAEPNGPQVRRRIAALEPERFTRMGAALRHTTSRLMSRNAEHRLLLLLSDGKPNDMDLYEGRYGVEDSRQAVAEARLQGIHPFCVTVDRHAPDYMPRIFGSGGFSALHKAENLPTVLVEVLRRLVKA